MTVRSGRRSVPRRFPVAHQELLLRECNERIVGIQGSAGVGKSHLIGTATGIAEREGYRVVVLAPYANQVERLQADGLKASTLATFLVSKEKNIDERTVIVIDEAGLVPTREMEAALQVAERIAQTSENQKVTS